MLKKKEIEILREKYLLGLRGAPEKIKDIEHRKLFRIVAVYVLGEVLELSKEEGD